MADNPLPGGPNIVRTPLMDKNGNMDPVWQRWFINVIQRIQAGLDIIGRFTGEIGSTATVEGRAGTLVEAVQHLSTTGQLAATALTGTIAAGQLPAALTTSQGAVVLPLGAPSNVLDTAAFQPSTAFDAAGSAATAQANAEAFAANGSNISSGTVAAARIPALSLLSGQITTSQLPSSGISATITTAKLTAGGTNGSMTFVNGILTASTPAT